MFVLSKQRVIFISGDIELLAFLRTSKYSMIECYKRFNNFLKLMAKFPQWFDRDEKALKSAMELYESGYLVPLPERDADGRRILLIRASKIDETKYVANDIIRLIYDVLFYSMEEEETSITGYVILVDYTGITLKQSTLLSFLDYKALNESASNANPGRHKKLILFNLPTYVSTLAEMIKMAFSAKLRKRLFLLEESQLKDHIDVKYLPKEYGGTVSLEECLHEFTEFKRTFEENRNNWYDLKIDMNLIPGVNNVDHNIGSFRKLNID